MWGTLHLTKNWDQSIIAEPPPRLSRILTQ